MTKPEFNVICKARSFTGEDGKQRTAYQTLGAAWRDEDGSIARIRLDAVPIAFDGMLYLRARKEGGQ